MSKIQNVKNSKCPKNGYLTVKRVVRTLKSNLVLKYNTILSFSSSKNI